MAKEPKQLYRYLSAGFLCVFCACIFVFFLLQKELVEKKNTVVIRTTAECRFEPLASATAYFTLDEGVKVTVITERNGWVKRR